MNRKYVPNLTTLPSEQLDKCELAKYLWSYTRRGYTDNYELLDDYKRYVDVLDPTERVDGMCAAAAIVRSFGYDGEFNDTTSDTELGDFVHELALVIDDYNEDESSLCRGNFSDAMTVIVVWTDQQHIEKSDVQEMLRRTEVALGYRAPA